MSIKVFESEEALAELISANTSVSCYSLAEEASKEEIEKMSDDGVAAIAVEQNLASAEIQDNDLFHHKSILVTTNWNNNDDIFLPEECWAARYTPKDKPTNLDHKSSKIVGHMTGNWPILPDGTNIDSNTLVADLPPKFHILAGAVIYKKFHNDPEHQKTTLALIQDIKDKKQFVSMECSFNGFDYGLRPSAASGSEITNLKIIERNASTAFLTKHLRIYGGSGEYQGYKIGRVLRNISFIGKAYTKQPANKESVIFTTDNSCSFANSIFINKIPETFEKKKAETSGEEKNSVELPSKPDFNGEISMSDQLQNKVTNLENSNQALASQVKELQDKLAKADTQKYEENIKSLSSSVEELQEALSAKKEELKKKSEDMEKAKADVEKAAEANEKLTQEVQELRDKQVTAERVDYLVAGKLDLETAKAKAESLKGLDEELFKSVADSLIEAYAMKNNYSGKDDKEKMVKEEAMKKSKVAKDKAAKADLDDTKPEDTDETVASETSQDKGDEAIIALSSKLAEFLKTSKKQGDK